MAHDQFVETIVDGMTAETTPAATDLVPFSDVSENDGRKITIANLLKVLGGMTALTAPASADSLGIYDLSATDSRSITLENLFGLYAMAGSATALYVLGLAAVAPFLGRMIDRIGPRPVLAVSTAIYPAMLLSLVLLALYSDGHAWVALAAFLAGASFPPITICMRALYPRLLPEAGLLQSAYSVDSALVEFIFIVGPALVAAFVAAGMPVGAIVFAAVCAAGGNVLFLRTPAVREWQVHPASGRRSLLGEIAGIGPHHRLLNAAIRRNFANVAIVTSPEPKTVGAKRCISVSAVSFC